MAIHRQRFGRYWYYWVLIVAGVVFVCLYYGTDGFGYGATLVTGGR